MKRIAIIAPNERTDDIAVEEVAQNDEEGHELVDGYWVQLGHENRQLARDLDVVTTAAIAESMIRSAGPISTSEFRDAVMRIRDAAGLEGE